MLEASVERTVCTNQSTHHPSNPEIPEPRQSGGDDNDAGTFDRSAKPVAISFNTIYTGYTSVSRKLSELNRPNNKAIRLGDCDPQAYRLHH
jgi:hypothetical protein